MKIFVFGEIAWHIPSNQEFSVLSQHDLPPELVRGTFDGETIVRVNKNDLKKQTILELMVRRDIVKLPDLC